MFLYFHECPGEALLLIVRSNGLGCWTLLEVEESCCTLIFCCCFSSVVSFILHFWQARSLSTLSPFLVCGLVSKWKSIGAPYCLPPARSVGANALSEGNRPLGVNKYLSNKGKKYFTLPGAKGVRLQQRQAIAASTSLAWCFLGGAFGFSDVLLAKIRICGLFSID